MKTFSEYHAKERGARIIMLVLAAMVGYLYYQLTESVVNAVLFFTGIAMASIAIGYVRTAFTMFGDWVKVKLRMQWETSMLTSIQLATAAEAYHIDNPNVLSAFHAAVQERQDEGVKFGYLELGEL